MYVEKLTYAQLLNLPLLLHSILTIIYPSSFAWPLQYPNRYIKFFINDVLENEHNIGQHSYSKPMTLFNLKGDRTMINPNGRFNGLLPYLTSAQALELGNVTVFEQELMSTMGKGKVEGIFVTSSDGVNSCMVAMTVIFSSGKYNSLRFFGELRSSLFESHIAVVGGTGRYYGANGFAVVKAIGQEVGGRRKKKLLFNVHIK